MIELALETIKYVVALLEVGPKFAPNQEVGRMRDLWKYLLMNFEILN